MAEPFEIIFDPKPAERVRDALIALRASYDLTPYEYTRRVVVLPGCIPHSHPELTLNGRVHEPEPLLSVYLHEQMHWYVTWYSYAHRAGWDAIIAEVRRRYPDIPVRFPEGAHTPYSSHVHVIVNALEVLAVSNLLGLETARNLAANTWVYSGIYRIVLKDWSTLTELFSAYALMPIRSALTLSAADLALAARMDEAGAAS